MKAINRFEQLKQATGGLVPSDTLDRFKQDLVHSGSRRKSQLVALKILRSLRRKGISQKQFAEQLAVTPQQVNKWVKGRENFTFDTIEKIEKALGIALIDVVEEKSRITAVSTPIKTANIYTRFHCTSASPEKISHKIVRKNRTYSRTRQYA